MIEELDRAGLGAICGPKRTLVVIRILRGKDDMVIHRIKAIRIGAFATTGSSGVRIDIFEEGEVGTVKDIWLIAKCTCGGEEGRGVACQYSFTIEDGDIDQVVLSAVAIVETAIVGDAHGAAICTICTPDIHSFGHAVIGRIV